MNYLQKYLKYKKKYLYLQNITGGDVKYLSAGSYGCVFTTTDINNNKSIIKIYTSDTKTNSEICINLFLKYQPGIDKNFTIIQKYTIYTYNDDEQHYDIIYGDNLYGKTIDYYIEECRKNSDLALDTDKKKIIFLIEMPNSGISFIEYIKKYIKEHTVTESQNKFIELINKSLISLQILHSFNILHNDLHLDNILIDSDENCRILDFGKSIKYNTPNITKDKFPKISSYTSKSPDMIFLDDIEINISKIIFGREFNHTKKFEDFKIQLNKNVAKFEPDYFTDIKNLFKLDLYKFGISLDQLIQRNDDLLVLIDDLQNNAINNFIMNSTNLDHNIRILSYNLDVSI